MRGMRSSSSVVGSTTPRRKSCGRATTSFVATAAAIVWARPHPQDAVVAITANPNPIFVHDEHGNILSRQIYFRGDEKYHWYEDPDGYTLIDDPEYYNEGSNTRKVYATIDPGSGHLVSTGVRFSSSSSDATINYWVNPRILGLQKHLKPSINVRKEMCGYFCEDYENNYYTEKSGEGGREKYRRKFQEEHVHRRKLVSNTDALRNLVILIRFADHQERVLPSVGDYNVLLNGPGGVGTCAPTGSVNDVFLSNSYGSFHLNSTIYPWVTVSMPESYYANGQSGTGTQIFEAIHEVLNVIDSDPSMDISQFNTDYNQGDAYIDAITVFHSGYGAEFGGVDCYGTKESDRIWSHSWFMYTGDWTSKDGTVSVSRYHINPGLWGVCGSNISRIGVIAHETAHFLGLPDLYDPVGGNGIGIYCLMSDSWGIDGSQLYPPLLSPWSKIMLGWMTPTTIVTEGDFALRQSWQYPDVYRIDLGPSEYLLIENRQPGSYDVLYPLGGLAIWHIDDNYAESFGNLRDGYPGQFNWPANGNHYHVTLLQADGKYDLERGRNTGDYSDLFRYDYFLGIDHLFPSELDPMIGPFPNTDSYALGVVKRSNHFISGISATGPNMTFSFLPSSPCQPDEIHFSLALATDGNGDEVSWSLKETYTGAIALSGNGYNNNERSSVETCLPAQCFTFFINDTGNDGLCCSFGTGGFVVRMNGLKVATGNEFGSSDEHNLPCIRPPTSAPTSASSLPTTSPSKMPSRVPSLAPTLIPPVECEHEKGLLEISIDMIETIQWEVQDLYGRTMMSSINGRIQECIDLNSCYTFSYRCSVEDGIIENANNHGMFSVVYNDEVLASGSIMFGDHTTMFGNHCLGDGDSICTLSSDASTPMSMFRLELAVGTGTELSWSLLNGTMHEIWSAGPFGDCDVNTLALCLPRMDCYEFTLSNNSANNTGSFTVLFSEVNESMIQNYTGTVHEDSNQRVFLGTCYDMNYNRDDAYSTRRQLLSTM